jgi:hypothetical protein
MTLGGCAALVLSVFAITELGPEPAARAPLRQSVIPGHEESAEPRLRLAQQYGTVCQTPQGSVCTVAPQPINSRCECGGTYGLIVR